MGGSVSAINLSNVGYGFATAPEVVINNFGTGGTGATATAEFDSLSKKLTGIKITNGGSGYTSPPEILILGGFPTVVSTGKSAQATAFIFLDLEPENNFDIDLIRVDDPGYGYNSAPEVKISHPIGENAVAVAIMGPSPVFGLEVSRVDIIDGGQNYSPENQIVISFVGGQAFETESFKVDTSDPGGEVTKVEFLSLGGGLFRKFSSRSLPPYKGEWDAPLAGKYHLYTLAHDNRNNITSSRLLLENVVNPTAPQVQLTPYDRAQVTAVIKGGVITELKLEHNGSYYNSTPTLVIEGDGQGAVATASVDLLSGQLTSVNLLNGGRDYTYAKVRVFAGLEKQNVDPQIVLGETIMFGVSATDFDGDVVKLMLIENGDKTKPKEAVEYIIDQNFEPGSFQYDGAEPYFSVYYSPIALGGLELQIAAQDDDGFITYSNPLNFQVVNGEVPLSSLVTPYDGGQFSVGSEQLSPITLVAKASDPDWGFNNNVDELSRISGMMFFANNRFIGYGTKVDGTDHYFIEWNATVTGDYEVVAAAVDSQVGTPYLKSPEDLPNVISNRGNTGISRPIKVSIKREFASRLPSIELLTPLPQTLTNVTSTSTIRLQVKTSDPDGGTKTIQFYVNGSPYGNEIYSNTMVSQSEITYGTNWTPGVPGNYVIYAVTTDNSGNKVMSDVAVVTSTTGDAQVPTLTMNPFNTSYNVGDDIVYSVEATDNSISYNNPVVQTGFIEEVAFFVNGNQTNIDISAPYYDSFSPTEAGEYEVFAQARDNQGNIGISQIRTFTVKDKALELQMFLNSSSSFYDGTSFALDVKLTGKSEDLNGLLNNTIQDTLKLYVNGGYYNETTLDPSEEYDNNGDLISLGYKLNYTASYSDHADCHGTVSLRAILSNNNQISTASNSISINIIAPTPWIDPDSNLLNLRNDILGPQSSVNSIAEINNALAATAAGRGFEWLVGQLENDGFKNCLDLFAAHHIIYGNYYASYPDFKNDLTEYITNVNLLPGSPQLGSILWLKRFIDAKLQSGEFTAKNGQLPLLVGNWPLRKLYNFPENRRDIINLFYTNKYGFEASYSQRLQGSARLLNTWVQYQEDYWEISKDDDNVRDVNRRDNIPPNNFVSGELAVDLVWQLTMEVQLEGGMPYILGSNRIRATVYTPATLAALILKEDWEGMQSDQEKSLLGRPADQVITSLTRDSRYIKDYNFIWRDSTVLSNLDPNWKYEAWFGTFNDASFPWIFHSQIGWLYCGSNTQCNTWFYSPKFGWIWTQKSLNSDENYINFYSDSLKSWIVFKKNSSEYFSSELNQWVSF